MTRRLLALVGAAAIFVVVPACAREMPSEGIHEDVQNFAEPSDWPKNDPAVNAGISFASAVSADAAQKMCHQRNAPVASCLSANDTLDRWRDGRRIRKVTASTTGKIVTNARQAVLPVCIARLDAPGVKESGTITVDKSSLTVTGATRDTRSMNCS